MKKLRKIPIQELAVLLFVSCSVPLHADVFTIDAPLTFLRVNGESSDLSTTPIDLFSLSFPVASGDFLSLSGIGDWSPGTGAPDTFRDLIGVFSSSATLLSGGNLHRVVGAIDAGSDVETEFTYNGNLPTDIPEDFLIADRAGTVSSLEIQVPDGARYLFLSVIDSFYGDNLDPDGDFAIQIGAVPEPSTAATGMFALTVGLLRRRRTRKVI